MEREKLVCNLTCCFRASEFTGTTTLTDTALRSDRAEDWNKQRGKCYAVLANVQGTGSCDSVTVWHRLWRCDSFDFSHLRSNWCYDDGSFKNKPVSFESQLWVVVVFFLGEPDMIGVWHRWPAEHFTPESLEKRRRTRAGVDVMPNILEVNEETDPHPVSELVAIQNVCLS